MKKTTFLFLLIAVSCKSFAQGTFSGDLMMNMNFFMKDTNIKASGNPLYDNALSGSEGWLSLRYSNTNGLTFFVRADAFNNSNLKYPGQTNTDFGIGAWNATKEFNDLTISVGTIYDQIGSGILFRSYEDRGLLIDNALVGVELKYKLTNNILLKAFTGQQKNNSIANDLVNNVRYAPVIKGFNADGDFSVGKVHLNPGFGVLNRTLDGATMQSVAATINSQPLASRFVPMYNMYAFTAYNTLIYKNFSWYAEGSYKTHEAINIANPYDASNGLLADRAGNVEYTSLNYGKKGIALSLTGKRAQDFAMRVSPLSLLNEGRLNWQPIVAVLRPDRLMSRYTPSSQDLSEMSGTANLILSPTDVATYTFTYTKINTLDGHELYTEAYGEASYQGIKSWLFNGGVQYLEYNAPAIQNESSKLMQYSVTPFAEITYKVTDRKSVRLEVSYMDAIHDYGSWVYAILEYNLAPKFSISVSDMYNTTPNKGADNPNYKDPGNHYYSVYTAYNKGPHRFSLAYVKQVDGINCAGGVCRYEPAFSGVKATITTSF